MKKGIEKILASKFWWIGLIIFLFAVNFLASVLHARFDLTKEKRYSLSKATSSLLSRLDDRVEIDVFLKGEFPAGFRKLANSTRDFLELLKEKNRSKIHFRFVSPLDEVPGTQILYGDSLARMGAISINLTVQRKAGQSSNIIFPVAVLRYKGRELLVNLYPVAKRDMSQTDINSAESLMEYQFASAFDKLMAARKPVIAYATGNGEPADGRVQDMAETIKKDYTFLLFDLARQPIIPQKEFDLLLIVKPSLAFTEDEKLKLDQYVMQGGKLLCFIDNLYAEQDSLSFKPETIAFDRNLNLTDLFFRYGLRINTDLIMDLQCDLIPFVVGGTPDHPQLQLMPWNYFPLLSVEKNQVNNDLGYIAGRFVNSIDTIQTEGVRKTPLLVSSSHARIIGTPALISLNENKIAPEDEKFQRNKILAAVLLEGKFTSIFRNRVSQSQRDSLASHGLNFTDQSVETKMIVAADGDIVFNEYVPDPENPEGPPQMLQMGWNKYTFTEKMNQSELGKLFNPVANRQFLINSIEYLVSNSAISQIRNKEIVLRLLDKPKVEKNRSLWQFINIALPVLLVIIFGVIYQQVRKLKHS
ncbi:MAG TPA: gliding motility-associated ABC transporter substrate-binding protein GldG [Chitinophagaceae bacterium]|nr:gliding motility-associated ABC transporter substrate-binding protein GldG [Chitinophagaceae bacterium]